MCIKDYANDENVITRVEPVFSEHRFNPVPVRIIIDKDGKVKHIHFLSAFPDQAKAISDALKQWQFKRYVRAGQPVRSGDRNYVWARGLSCDASSSGGTTE